MNATTAAEQPSRSTTERLVVRSVEVPEFEQLLDRLPADVPGTDLMSWVREGDGLVGWGRAAARRTSGASRFTDAEQWWQQVVDRADVRDEVAVPGSGLVAFGSFSFADDSPRGGSLVVPRVVIGRRGGRSWVTTITPLSGSGSRNARPQPPLGAGMPPAPSAPPARGMLRDGAVAQDRWPGVVAGAIGRIGTGEVDKVVLARDVIASFDGDEPNSDADQQPIAGGAWATLDLRWPLRRLAHRYHRTWTFAVDGLIGATPELLVRLEEGWVSSRVLAGTVQRTSATSRDDRVRAGLTASAKERQEHDYAVTSVTDVLRPHCASLQVPTEPFVLELPNVFHLASDVSGPLANGSTSLRLAADLHPSAAVCGAPQPAASRIIGELEGMDRGGYAGPVGWMDASGDGEWGIALRCGELDADGWSMRLFAGGGIVAASDPDAELAETQAKLAPMRYALGLD